MENIGGVETFKYCPECQRVTGCEITCELCNSITCTKRISSNMHLPKEKIICKDCSKKLEEKKKVLEPKTVRETTQEVW